MAKTSARYRVVKPGDDYFRRFRLCAGAESKVGQVGTLVQSQTTSVGTQRRLQFEDSTIYWYYPGWLQRTE